MRRFDLRRGAVSAIALLACLAVEAPAVAAPTVNLALLDRVT